MIRRLLDANPVSSPDHPAPEAMRHAREIPTALAGRAAKLISAICMLILVLCLGSGLIGCAHKGDSAGNDDSGNEPISDRSAQADAEPRRIWIVESMTGSISSDAYDFVWSLDSAGRYDDEGRLIERRARTFDGMEYVCAEYSYDDQGRPVSYVGSQEDEVGGIFSEAWTANWSDDGLSCSWASVDTPVGMSAGFTYDADGRLVGFQGTDMHVGQNTAAPMADYGYDGLGRLVSLTGTDGWRDSNVDIHYSGTGVLSRIDITGSMGDWSYLYDSEGRLIQRIGDGRTIEFVYDGSGALVSASGEGVDATFTTDGNGNIATADILYVEEPGGATTHTVYELAWREVAPDENGVYPFGAASMLDPIRMARLGDSVSDDLFSPVSGGDPASMVELDRLIQQGLARAASATPEELESAAEDRA
ncbi:MAG: hypothetical protein IJH87_05050 [Atopobiaceae bacterium]|nr:hypothetical protein [Atopobiaceae bacterium]